MRPAEKEFLSNLADFSLESMLWCARESEDATEKINMIINFLLEDATRVSALSNEVLEAVDSMRHIVNNLTHDGDREAANDLALALQQTAAKDDEINGLVSPILEAMQFQDRITQNMDNLSKMMRAWIEAREAISQKESFSAEERTDFGNKLLAITTMSEERDAVRAHIPGLEEEEKTTSNVLFF